MDMNMNKTYGLNNVSLQLIALVAQRGHLVAIKGCVHQFDAEAKALPLFKKYVELLNRHPLLIAEHPTNSTNGSR
jgi:hypothetical protein